MTHIKEEYDKLDMEYRQVKDGDNFLLTKSKLAKMISFIKDNRSFFEEADDELKILEFRDLMLDARMARHKEQYVELLKKAVKASTPTACSNAQCENYVLENCDTRRTAFIDLQKKMCIEKINVLSTILKVEAALHVRTFDIDLVLKKRKLAVEIHKKLLGWCNHETDKQKNSRRMNQCYLEYWLYVTQINDSLQKGTFDSARNYLQEAYQKGKLLDSKHCFPNYFRTVAEIGKYKNYIDGVECIKNKNFIEGADNFSKWLSENSKKENTTRLRYDNIRIFEIMCHILAKHDMAFSEGKWSEVESLLENTYVARTTWVLWNRILKLRDLVLLSRERADISKEINKISEDWNLFLFDTPLLGEDRTLGLVRPLNLLFFLDINYIEDSEDWQQLMIQNMRNALLLKADYEKMRCAATVNNLEKMDLTGLFDSIVTLLDKRNPVKADQFKRACAKLDDFIKAVDNRNFYESDRLQRLILLGNSKMGYVTQAYGMMRSLPHVIEITKERDVPDDLLFDANYSMKAKEIMARRFGSITPNTITFEVPLSISLKKGSFYYLNPRWNVKAAEQYRTRHEDFYKSEIPRWINVFFQNIFGTTHSQKAAKFRDWILQFDKKERLLACKFFDKLKYYDETEQINIWSKIAKKLPKDVIDEITANKVCCTRIGHLGKSSAIELPCFSKGLKIASPNVSGHEKFVFRDLSEYTDAEGNLKKEKALQSLDLLKPETIVFIDDFIGTGGQAVDFLKWIFKTYKWLDDTIKIYLCVLVGFENAIQSALEIKIAQNEEIKKLQNKIRGVKIIIGEPLKESDKAFSKDNPIWESDAELQEAEMWAKCLGNELLKTWLDENPQFKSAYDNPEYHALGWHNCQALVAFSHNIPSDTLPLFWCEGKRNGKKWKYLFKRYE